ncbi:hypothetical protein KC324_g13137 [Hortaea werneckii]|nr:hypothetical protein KC334_g5414 [Hortaea werneckii]KAI7162494.1 hypothetical protein KC324_g13137 [Hortaea werneckii]
MPSTKGEPTDPELREKIKEEVKNEEKGKLLQTVHVRQMRYEAAGGDYKDTGDNKNKAQKGAPEKKEGK